MNQPVLGIDPGIRHLGYVLICRVGQRIEVFSVGTHALGSADDVGAMMRSTFRTDLLPTLVVGIEEQRHVLRGKTERGMTSFAASAVRDVQYAAAGAARALGWPVFFIAPTTAKAALCSAKADKEQMKRAARTMYGDRIPRWQGHVSEHEADALGVALATLRRLETSHRRAASNAPALASRSRDSRKARVNARLPT